MGFEEIGSKSRGEDAALLYILFVFQVVSFILGINKLV